MIEPALRKFCESPYRKLIVIGVTFIVGLVLIMPLVDAIREGHDEKENLLVELDSARSVAAELKGFEARVADKFGQLKGLEDRTVNDDTMPALRGVLVDIAKETECNIRRLNVGTTASRSWKPGENPFAPATETKTAEPTSGPKFQLEWRPVSVSLSGTSTSLKNMIQRVAASKKLMHIKSLEMYPSSPNRQTLTLDMEVWYFTLARKG
ncbi:MAG: hypothetical protein IT427_10000 [Pirellulales bacterium]|nr:hypothetical protein [Pirellulales bacterium]